MTATVSFRKSLSCTTRTVAVCQVLQLPVVNDSVFCTPGLLPSVSSTVTAPVSALAMVTVTLAVGADVSRTRYACEVVSFSSSSRAMGPASTTAVVDAMASISTPPTVMVKVRLLLALPSAFTASTTTVYMPARVGAPQIVRSAEQAPVPATSNAMPGGSPTTT